MYNTENSNKSIPGYDHPEKQITKQTGKYENQYKIFNSQLQNDSITTQLENKCPLCNEEALYECDCNYKDKQCKYGHIWFISQNKKIIGDPHK